MRTKKERDQFKAWQKRQRKKYKSAEEEENAIDNFAQNQKKVNDFNKRKNETYEQDIQDFSDEVIEELIKKKAGLQIPKSVQQMMYSASKAPEKIVRNAILTSSTTRGITKSPLIWTRPASIQSTLRTTNKLQEVLTSPQSTENIPTSSIANEETSSSSSAENSTILSNTTLISSSTTESFRQSTTDSEIVTNHTSKTLTPSTGSLSTTQAKITTKSPLIWSRTASTSTSRPVITSLRSSSTIVTSPQTTSRLISSSTSASTTHQTVPISSSSTQSTSQSTSTVSSTPELTTSTQPQTSTSTSRLISTPPTTSRALIREVTIKSFTTTRPRVTTSAQRLTTLMRNSVIPPSVNFTDSMQPVKDQLNCGSCYAFAAVAIVEYNSKITAKKDEYLSEQNIVDCQPNGYGCNGGWPGAALDYIKQYGLADGSSSQYEYVGTEQSCKRDRFPPIQNLTNYCTKFLGGNEVELMKLVAFQPTVVGVRITDGMMYYRKGVFFDTTCTNQVNHAVVVVGYGTDPIGGDYWIIRNSWGANWGMNGYGWFARNRNNHCGIANVAFYLC